MNSHVLLSVVVVTHNSSEELAEFVPFLRSGVDVLGMELILVDSGSAADLAPKEGMDGVDVIIRLPNVGYGTAANRGLARARADWVAVLNPDVRVRMGDLLALRVAALNANLDMISPIIRTEDGEVQPHYAAVPTPPWVRRGVIDEPIGDGIRSAWALHGSVLVMRLSTLARVGGFDEGYFLYFEEIDLARRIRVAGGQIGWTSRVRAIHRNESSSGAVPPAWRLAQRARGKCRFMRQQYGTAAAVASAMQDALTGFRQLPPSSWAEFVNALVRDPRAGIAVPKAPLIRSRG